MDLIKSYLFFNPKYKNLSKNLLLLQYKKDYNNEDIIKNFQDFYKKYPNFNSKFYNELYDLKFNDKKKIILHWLNFGIYNNYLSSINDFYLIYKNFDCKFYKQYYEINLENEYDIIFHFLKIGKYRNYYGCKLETNLLSKKCKFREDNEIYLNKNNYIKNIGHLFVHFFKCGGGEIYLQNFINYSKNENYLLLDIKYNNFVNKNCIPINILYYENKDELINLIENNNFDLVIDHQYYLFNDLYIKDQLIVQIIHSTDYYKKCINHNIKYTINLYNELNASLSWNNSLKIVNYLGINKYNLNYEVIKNKLFEIIDFKKYKIKNVAIVGRIDMHKVNINFLNKLIVRSVKDDFYIYNFYGNVEDSYKKYFFNKIKNKKYIKYHGLIEYKDINNIYINNDILLSPSKSEAGGTVLLEAMNNGLLVLARNKGGNKETINNVKYLVENDEEYFDKIIEIESTSYEKIIYDIINSKKKILFNHNNKYIFKNLVNNLNIIKYLEDKKNIPNIVHYIYGLKEQNEEFPFLFYYGILSNILINKPKKIFLHYQYIPHGYWWNKIKSYLTLNYINYNDFEINNTKVKHYAHKSDYLRLLILYRYGGIYYDIDTLCVKSHKKILNNEVVFGIQEKYKNEKDIFGNAIIFSMKNNFFIKLLIDEYPNYFSNDDWTSASLFMPTELYNNLDEENRKKITVLDKEYFYYPNYNEDYLIFNSNNEINLNLITYHYCNNYSYNYVKNINNINYIYNNNNFFSNLMKNIYNIYQSNFYKFDIKNKYDICRISFNKNLIIIIECKEIEEILYRIINIENLLNLNLNIFIYNTINIDKNLKILLENISYFKNINIYYIKLYNDINLIKKIDISIFLINETFEDNTEILIINNIEDIIIKIEENYILDYKKNFKFTTQKKYDLKNLINIFDIYDLKKFYNS